MRRCNLGTTLNISPHPPYRRINPAAQARKSQPLLTLTSVNRMRDLWVPISGVGLMRASRLILLTLAVVALAGCSMRKGAPRVAAEPAPVAAAPVMAEPAPMPPPVVMAPPAAAAPAPVMAEPAAEPIYTLD